MSGVGDGEKRKGCVGGGDWVAGGVCFVRAIDGIRGLVRSRGLGDVYEGQVVGSFTISFVLPGMTCHSLDFISWLA